jgi:F-type H+-transporting ATPase subunit gamma
MPSIKDLKKRIGSVKNTQQTTKAMKMVSAAKLRRAQDAIQNHRPYAQRIGDLIKLATSLQSGDFHHPLMARPEETATEGGKRVMLLLITSDRGLCGAFNTNVIKATQRWIASNEGKYSSIKLAFVGRRGYDFFKSRSIEKGPNFGEIGAKISFAKAKSISDALVKIYTDAEVDEIKIIYNEFKNAVSQEVRVENFLPLVPEVATENEAAASGVAQEIPMYLMRPNPARLLEQLIEKNFSIQTFRYLLESQAGEHGARMSAMENATKNAGEMIRKLTLQYNKQRQAGITKELLEIIAGSESQKG